MLVKQVHEPPTIWSFIPLICVFFGGTVEPIAKTKHVSTRVHGSKAVVNENWGFKKTVSLP
jgi:hypothetical protein